MKLEGLYTAMVTPFLHELLDENGFIELIHEQVAAQVDGLVVLGTTGEAPTLTEKECKRIIEITVQELQGAMPVIVGTGTNSTATTIERTKWAQDLGADIALVTMPYYNCPTQEGLQRHIELLLDQTEIPILLYNHPKRTGVNLEVPTLTKLSKHEKILGLKEASGDINHLNALFEAYANYRPQFSLLCGNDDKAFDWIQKGMKGLISVISNAFPLLTKQLINKLLHKNYKDAQSLFDQWSPFVEFCAVETNPIPIKGILSELGLPAGDPRLPLTALSPSYKNKLEDLLIQSPVSSVCKS